MVHQPLHEFLDPTNDIEAAYAVAELTEARRIQAEICQTWEQLECPECGHVLTVSGRGRLVCRTRANGHHCTNFNEYRSSGGKLVEVNRE